MTCPVQHEIITGALLPLCKRHIDNKTTNILFHDYYADYYEKFGIDRSEMMIVMPQVLAVDVLSGCDKLEYFGEHDTCDDGNCSGVSTNSTSVNTSPSTSPSTNESNGIDEH